MHNIAGQLASLIVYIRRQQQQQQWHHTNNKACGVHKQPP